MLGGAEAATRPDWSGGLKTLAENPRFGIPLGRPRLDPFKGVVGRMVDG